MKKWPKIRYKRRVLIYSVLVFIIIFSIVDYYFETFGLPEFAKIAVIEKLKTRGFDIDFDELKCGIVNGIVFTNTSINDPQSCLDKFFEAEKMKISLVPSFSGSFFFSISAFDITAGSLTIPLFPDFGEEGKTDIITIKNVNAHITLTGNDLDITYLKGDLESCQFLAYGSLKNIISSIISSSSSGKNKHSPSFSAVPSINTIPYQVRARTFRKFLYIRDELVFSGTPKCQLAFDIDALNPKSNMMKANVKLPVFEYGGFSIKGIDSWISYRNNTLSIDEMVIRFSETGILKTKGYMDNNTGLISGTIDGRMTPNEIMGMLKVAEVELPVAMEFSKPLTFKLKLKDFSLNSSDSQGTLDIEISEADFKGVNMKNIKSELSFEHGTISAKHLSFSTDRNKVTGNIDYNPSGSSINASIQSSGPPLFIAQIMEGDNKAMMNDILARLTFPEDDRDVEMSADVHCSWGDEFFYYIAGNIVMNSFKYFDTAFTSGDARIIIDSNDLLIIPMMTLLQEDSIATLAMVYDNSTDMKYHVESPFFRSSYQSNNRFLSDIQSSLPGKDVLNCIFPEWESEALDMSDHINMKAGGIIDFSGNSDDATDFKVTIIDSSCKWYSMPVTQLHCDLIFEQMNMEIKNTSGKVYDGDLSLYYKTNFNTNKGEIEIDLKDAGFAPIATHADWDLKDEQGKLSVVSNIDFEYDEKDNLLMTGSGKLTIRNANLWEVPIIRTFGKFTSQWIGDRWGVISDLDADFKYRSNHIFSDNIQTNGNIIALRSNGSYFWSTGDFNFLIHAEVLKNVLPLNIISKILDPITGLMEKRVTKKKGVIKWGNVSLNEKLFSEEKE